MSPDRKPPRSALHLTVPVGVTNGDSPPSLTVAVHTESSVGCGPRLHRIDVALARFAAGGGDLSGGGLPEVVLDGQTAKLTQAGLETLAIVAYRQPVSRARVSAVRGVNVDAVMRTIVTRGLVEEAGNDPETGAVLYRTTEMFLHKLGLTSLDELPALAPYLPEVDALDDFALEN